MTELRTTHHTTVTEDQIDHLGHMNVRFYGVAASAATDAVLTELGRPALGTDLVDLYTRHHREQLLGASLTVQTGVLDAAPGRLALYHELVNTTTGDVAATFVHGVVSADRSWPDVADLRPITPPPHGKPRSISLDRDPAEDTPEVAELVERGLAVRQPRQILADECDDTGRLRATDAPGLHWGGEPIDGAMGPMLHDGPDGQVIGMASMETRLAIHRFPTVGTRIQSFGATLAVHDKVQHQIMWVFDLDSGEVISSFEVVNLAFDTVGRRAVSFPPDLRAQAEARLWRP